jgi:hypothetical protein
MMNAVLLKSLPVPNPEQLYLVQINDQPPENARFSYPTFQNARAAMPQRADLAATSWPAQFYATMFGAAGALAIVAKK